MPSNYSCKNNIIYENSCLKCANYLGRLSCMAYPAVHAIPKPIWKGEEDHKAPFEGDNGIQFEPREDN